MSTKTASSHTVNHILEVHNYNSSVNSYYGILAPIQLTLEYCRGLSSEDFSNILMVSPTETYCTTMEIDETFEAFNARTPHQHDYFELLIVLEGEVIQKIEDKEYIYRAGTCCLINRNIIHAEKFIGEAKLLFIGLSIDFIRELLHANENTYFKSEPVLSENTIFQFFRANIEHKVSKTYFDFFPTLKNHTSIHELHRISDLLLNTMLMPKLGVSYMIKGLICELFQYLETNFYVTSVNLTSNTDFLLFSRISHLLEDTNGRMSRTQLESTLHYSGNYLNTIVKNHTGMCLFDYGMTFCLKKAASLLVSTDDSIAAIAGTLGFTNRTHFYKLFTKKYEMSP